MSDQPEQSSEVMAEPEPGPKSKAGLSFRKVAKGIAFLLVAGLVLAAAAVTSAYTVPAGKSGVVLRLGAYAGTTGPGLHFRLPFGIDRIEYLEGGTVRTETFGFRNVKPGIGNRPVTDEATAAESTMLTGDLSVVNLEWTVSYRIHDPKGFLFSLHDPVQTVRDAGEEAMRQAVGDMALDTVLRDRAALGMASRDRLQASLDALGSGVQVTEVRIQDIAPPAPVKAAFQEVDEAQQEKDLLVHQALADCNREIPKARGEAAAMVSAAEGYALERVNRAQGEASRFSLLLREYRGAPEVTKKWLFLETCREVLPKARQVIVVDGRFRDALPKLDLDRGTPGGGK
ncbi:MAG TPA: FtsH protease activity modulator HflK [Deltaproteobacteria bacterium]|nr:FtsH protease activity modulator HflK [Deltaproteobacteria bacterium]